MKEDLIESLTTIVFRKDMNRLLMAFARVSTRDEEDELKDQMKLFKDVKPRQIGIGSYFTLDSSSKIEKMFIK